MPSRFYLNATDQSGQTIYSEQILRNHECFPEEYLVKLGLEVNSEGLIEEQEVNIHDFLKCFQEYYSKEVFPRLYDKTGKDLLDYTLFIELPSYTTIGHYAIVQNALFRLSSKASEEKLTFTVSFS